MTKRSVKGRVVDLKRLVEEDQDYLRAMVQSLVEATLEAEMTAALGAEKGARSQGAGIWAGSFDMPWAYRERSWTEAANQTPDPDCPIKGNINGKGERIYHTPWGSRSYDRTKIDPAKGERWFCDEAEAVAAGWRAPFN